MSRETVLASQGPFDRAYSLLAEYIDICPENIWAEGNGGWPVWQQIAHTVMVMDFFVCGENEQFLPAPCDVDTAMLKVQGGAVIDKSAMKTYLAEVKAKVDVWFQQLTDADLPLPNVILTKKIGRALSYIAVVVMLTAHTNYHLGSCDAALRNHDLPGVF